MDNLYFQVAIGVLPLLLFSGIMAAAGAKHRIRNIMFAGLMLVVGGGSLAMSFGADAQDSKSAAQSHDTLSLVYAVADEGNTDLAAALLDDLRQNSADKPDFTLCAARLAAGAQDWIAARALYAKALPSFPDAADEYEAVQQAMDADAAYYGVLESSESPSAYTARTQALDSSQRKMADAMQESIAETNGNTYHRAAELIVFADEAHQSYMRNEELDALDIPKQLRKMNTLLEEEPGLHAVPQVRLARLKMQILTEDYKGIAKNVDQNADYNELLIVSELYINGYVKQSDFTGTFSKESTAKYNLVYDQLNNIYNNQYQDKSREERNAAKAQLTALRTMIKNPALGKIEQSLSMYTTSDYALDASKVFLQMAKIEYSVGNEPKVAEYLDRSLDTVGDCSDSDYTVPMYELVSIITDKDSVERLKDVPAYVDDVLSNNMTLKLAEPIEPAQSADPVDNEDSLASDFSAQMETYVSQKRMSVKIVNVDTSDFEPNHTIRATVNFSNNLYTNTKDLKDALRVTDCSVDIKDFTMEKVDYTGANILLCVDVSGSMGGYKIQQLKDAVKLFVSDKAAIENIALVTFDNGILSEYDFNTDQDTLIAAADAIYAAGGTNMYGALIHSISKFSVKPGEINSIILMSDGLDGSRASFEQIQDSIGAPCAEKGITVYSIGFGSDADSAYLSSLASVTGGTYLYASEPTADSQMNQLSAFFDGLRAQILNQYVITFEAVNTLSYTRILQVNLGDGLDGDKVTYYLGGGKDAMTEPQNDEDSPLYMESRAIYGFEPRLLFKNGRTQNIILKGEGFESSDSISVSLKGTTNNMEYALGAAFADANTVQISVPGGIGLDVYDAYIEINGKTAVLAKGLSIFMQGAEQVTDFGPYRFTSYIKQTDKQKNETMLSGHVALNGWLNFNGDVTLKGDLKGGVISLADGSGSYVQYQVGNSVGIAATLADIGLPVSIPALGVISLYNDEAYEKVNFDARVEVHPIQGFDIGNYFGFNDVRMSLHPNRVGFETENISAQLPFAGKLLREKMDLFSFDIAGEVSVSSKAVDCRIDVEYEAGDSWQSTVKSSSFGNLPIFIAPEEFEVHVNTLTNDYSFKFMISLPFITEGPDVGLEIAWDNPDTDDALGKHSNGLVPTLIKLYADIDITTTVSGVPLTWSNFMLGLSDIDTSKSPLYWTLNGGFDLAAVEVTALPGLAGLKAWIGDLSLLKIADATISLNLGNIYFGAKGDIKILEEINFGSLAIDIGKFSYSSTILGMSNEDVFGLRAQTTLGPKWEFGGNKLIMQGTTEIDAMSKFIGLQHSGEFTAEFDLWIISPQVSAKGGVALGIRRTSSNDIAFVLRTSPNVVQLTFPSNVAGKL